MTEVELYRAVVTITALVSLAVNLSLVVGVLRHWDQAIASKVWVAYAAAAAGTNVVSVYWRLRDEVQGLPLGPGDFTVLVPTFGFLAAGILAWRFLGHTIGRASVDI